MISVYHIIFDELNSFYSLRV